MKQDAVQQPLSSMAATPGSRSPASAFRNETERSRVGKKDLTFQPLSAYVWVHVERHVSACHIRMSWLVCRFVTGYSRIPSLRDTLSDTPPYSLNPCWTYMLLFYWKETCFYCLVLVSIRSSLANVFVLVGAVLTTTLHQSAPNCRHFLIFFFDKKHYVQCKLSRNSKQTHGLFHASYRP